MQETQALPTSQAERITTLDALRGIAVFGILLVNIQSFALPGPVRHDPSVLNEVGINFQIWFLTDWFTEGTQRALFSMLFGAGVLLFVGRKENKLEGLRPADLFFRRQMWLILFSTIDVYLLLWHGDILLDYAVIGMLVFAFRNLSPRKLILAASVCLLFMTLRENQVFFQDKSMIEQGEKVAALSLAPNQLTATQQHDLDKMINLKERQEHENKMKRMETDKAEILGSYSSTYAHRTSQYTDELAEYLYFNVWDVLACMLLGMAFFKLGILTGASPARIYWWMLVVGLGVGLTLSYIRIQLRIENHFNAFNFTKNVPFSFYEPVRISRAIGILGLIMLLFKSGWFNKFFSLLRPVGQMAFTNYLSQSLICTILFSGFGFAWYGGLQRYQIYEVVASIWLFQLIFCNLWLRFFLYGPFEWSWRSLTYWKKQPFLRT